MPIGQPSRTRLLALLFASLGPLPGFAGGPPPTFWLGGGGAPCNFASLSTAIGAVPDGAIINIANNQTYDGINVQIADRSVQLVGGWADCAGTPSSDRAVLTGQAGANLPVIRIQTGATPREVRLRNLHVRGGTRSGVEIAGALEVTFISSIVSDSQAMDGGGINVIGESPNLTTVQLIDTVIGRTQDGPETGNAAGQAGGGLRCVDAWIGLAWAEFRGNTSAHSGGGLYMDGCHLDLLNIVTAIPRGVEGELPSMPSISRFEDNDGAFFGGAIHARNGSELQFDGLWNGVVIDGNSSGRGAGVYLTGSGTRLEGEHVSIINNLSDGFGAGAFVEEGASLSLSRGDDFYGLCEPLAACSRIAGNIISTPATVAGSAVHLTQASLNLDQTEITGNVTQVFGQATLQIDGDSVVRISNSLIHGNDSGPGWLLHMDGPDSTVNITASTVVGNATGNTLIRVDSGDNESTLGLRNGIVWQPGTTILDAGDNDTIVSQCMNAHENGSINAQDHDPGFRSPESGDYRLRLDSPNVDACIEPFPGAEASDLLGIARPENLGMSQPAVAGVVLVTPYDRGAYELTDLIFADGFEPLPPPF